LKRRIYGIYSRKQLFNARCLNTRSGLAEYSGLTARDNQSRTGLFIKNNEKPRKHCVCEVFFLPEKRAENCSKTDGSTRTAPIQHPLISEA